MGVTPVTQAGWQTIMGNNPSHIQDDQRPVENVFSWDHCQDFCRLLSQKDGKKHRLPTEAEWEYACRAGTTTPFSFGETISTDQANYDGNSTYGRGRAGQYRQRTTLVASFPPNAWGLYDMHGNVWEWCQDRYGDYPRGDVKDLSFVDNSTYRVLRGGSWGYGPARCRAATRLGSARWCQGFDIGVRVCFCLD